MTKRGIILTLKELRELGIIKKKRKKSKRRNKVVYIDAKTGKRINMKDYDVGGYKTSSDHMRGNSFMNSNNLAIDALHLANEKARQDNERLKRLNDELDAKEKAVAGRGDLVPFGGSGLDDRIDEIEVI